MIAIIGVQRIHFLSSIKRADYAYTQKLHVELISLAYKVYLELSIQAPCEEMYAK